MSISKKNIFNRGIEISLALLLLLSAGIIFLKFSFTNAINLGIMFIFFFFVIEKIKLQKGIVFFSHPNWRLILFSFFLFLVNFSFLFFLRGEYDKITFEFFWFITLLACFSIDFTTLNKAVKVFANIFLISSVLALLNLFISFLGIDLPNIMFNVSTRDTTYYLYPGTVRLYGQDYSFFGLKGFRLAGWFPEPSIFGFLSCFVIYSGVFDKNRWKKIIVLLGLLFSMSAGSFVMIAGYFILGIKNIKTKILTTIGLFVFILSALTILPEEVLNRFFLDKFSGDVINNRITDGFDEYYENFINYGTLHEYILGRGVEVLNLNGFVASDYRGFILKFGLLGFFALALLIISYTSKIKDINTKLVVLYIFIIIFGHRSWIPQIFVFQFFVYYISLRGYHLTKQIKYEK